MESTAMVREGGVWDEQHSVGKTIALHLVPGALITAFYAVAAPVVRGFGLPSLTAIFLAIVFVLIPFELGYLFYAARRNGTTLGGVVRYREPVSRWRFVSLVVLLFVWAGIGTGLAVPLEGAIREDVFSFLPGWFLLQEDFSRYSGAALAITLVLGVIVNGIAAPITEELYFRGYLLPRISRFGTWAPLINTVLFSLYHFFTPWQNVGRILGLLPMVYAVWWKRSIYISMAVHVLGNLLSMAILAVVFFG